MNLYFDTLIKVNRLWYQRVRSSLRYIWLTNLVKNKHTIKNIKCNYKIEYDHLNGRYEFTHIDVNQIQNIAIITHGLSPIQTLQNTVVKTIATYERFNRLNTLADSNQVSIIWELGLMGVCLWVGRYWRSHLDYGPRTIPSYRRVSVKAEHKGVGCL